MKNDNIVLSQIREDVKRKFDNNDSVRKLYTVLLGRNQGNKINGVDTYTGVVFYSTLKNMTNQKHRMLWELRRDILIGVQNRGYIHPQNVVKVKSIRAQVVINGTTMYSEILNDFTMQKDEDSDRPKETVNCDDIHQVLRTLPLLQKSGSIIRSNDETPYGQAVVLEMGYKGYRNYPNGSVKAVVAQSKFGIKSMNLIDIIQDRMNKYIGIQQEATIKLRYLGIMTPTNIKNYFPISVARQQIAKQNRRNQILGRDTKFRQFAVLVDKFVATSEFDLLLFQKQRIDSDEVGYLQNTGSIGIITLDSDWKFQDLLDTIIDEIKVLEYVSNRLIIPLKSGKTIVQTPENARVYAESVQQQAITNITIFGLDEISVKNTKAFDDKSDDPSIQQGISRNIQTAPSFKRNKRMPKISQGRYQSILGREVTVSIPGVKKIQKGAFRYFGVSYIQDYSDLEVIQSRAFEKQDLKKIVIGKHVRKIGNNAFYGLDLSTRYLSIPENVEFIGSTAFGGNHIDVLKVENPNINLTQTAFLEAGIKKLLLPMALASRYNQVSLLKLDPETTVQFY